MFAVEALTAESFNVDGYAVARLHTLNIAAYLFYNTHHLVANSYSWNCSRHATMLYV